MTFSKYAKLKDSCNGTVTIDSEDTNVYVQTAYVKRFTKSSFYKKQKPAKCTNLVSGLIQC